MEKDVMLETYETWNKSDGIVPVVHILFTHNERLWKE